MTFALSERSQRKLALVHPDIKGVVEEAIKNSTVDFVVIEGLRTIARQKELVAAGASHTMNSRHLHGLAVDLAALVGNTITWQPKVYHQIADAMLTAGAKLQVPIVWGGSWLSFPDLVHWELSRKFYPDHSMVEMNKISDII